MHILEVFFFNANNLELNMPDFGISHFAKSALKQQACKKHAC